ncbi:unnamed protein product [Adineta ricciae]|uniref:Uncharacterized protein n=1 Tax=Adineta ricciae TaxID=249248 RepID=A0A815UZM9_ADIRI|nr:unnamed protein product [Adineta ricciae]
MDISLLLCVQRCSPYFAATTVKEILEILRPQIYPPDSKFGDTIKMFQIFLPTNLPSDLHRQGFKFAYAFCVWNNYPFHWRLWPAEFFPIVMEPHRFTSIIKCLAHISRQIVQRTSTYVEGQVYVISLVMSILPGVDCSSAIVIRNDLTEFEKQACLSTSKFDNFIDLVRGLIRGQPEETVAYFMPTSCESIPKSIGTSIDDDEDLKLN